MATTTYHAQLIKYLANGDQYILNLKNTGDDVSISRSLKNQVRRINIPYNGSFLSDDGEIKCYQ